MYAQSFLVISVRGIALEPITAASVASGCMGFMKAAFGLRLVFGFAAFAFFLVAIKSLPYLLAVATDQPMSFAESSNFCARNSSRNRTSVRFFDIVPPCR